MSLPQVHGKFRLAADPQLKAIRGADGNSTMVLNARIAASKSRYNHGSQSWENVRQVFIDVDYFGHNVHVLAGPLKKGVEVYVSGELVLDEWSDKTTGEKRSKVKILAKQFDPVMKLPTVVPPDPAHSGASTGQAIPPVTPNTGHPGGTTGATPSAAGPDGDSDPWGTQAALPTDDGGNPPF